MTWGRFCWCGGFAFSQLCSSCGGASFEAISSSPESATTPSAEVNETDSGELEAASKESGKGKDQSSLFSGDDDVSDFPEHVPEAGVPDSFDAASCHFNGPDYTRALLDHCSLIFGPLGCESFILSPEFENGEFVGASRGKCCETQFPDLTRMCLEVPR